MCIQKYIGKEKQMNDKVKNKEVIAKQYALLRKSGLSHEKIFEQSVVELIRQVGSDEINSLLQRLYCNANGCDLNATNCFAQNLIDGHQYVIDIFETYGFGCHLEWFYEITVEEFLELEGLELRRIPFLTYYLKKYVESGEMIEPEYLSLYDSDDEKYRFYIDTEES